MRTTLNISDALIDELRGRAKESGRPLRAVLEDVIQRGLASPPKQDKPIRITPHAAGIKPAYRGMSMNQLYDQIEAEDLARKL